MNNLFDLSTYQIIKSTDGKSSYNLKKQLWDNHHRKKDIQIEIKKSECGQLSRALSDSVDTTLLENPNAYAAVGSVQQI